jgi:hypothetical protein
MRAGLCDDIRPYVTGFVLPLTIYSSSGIVQAVTHLFELYLRCFLWADS